MEVKVSIPVKKQQTHRRDWIREAYDIGIGRSSAKPKKEHVQALVQACNSLSERTNVVLNFMQKFYADVTSWRKEKGLPVVALPKGIEVPRKKN